MPQPPRKHVIVPLSEAEARVEIARALAQSGTEHPADASGLPPAMAEDIFRELEAEGLLRRELAGFWSALDAALRQADFSPPADGRELALLDLACGPCFEGAVLEAFFRRPWNAGETGRRVRLFATDLRDRQIESARRRHAATEAAFRSGSTPGLSESLSTARIAPEFFAADAARLKSARELPDRFDVALIRHQNFWHDRPAWRKIFAYALDRIGAAGSLVITSYFDREHLLALESLKRLGGDVAASIPNPWSIPLDYKGKSTDRHVAVIRQGRSSV